MLGEDIRDVKLCTLVIDISKIAVTKKKDDDKIPRTKIEVGGGKTTPSCTYFP